MKGGKSLFWLVAILMLSCIDPVTLKVGTASGLLVVDGIITDANGPHQITLSRSQTLDNTRIPPAYLEPEKNAKVNVLENGTNAIALQEVKPGIYETPKTFKGQVGNTYSIEIATANGEVYNSTPELLSAAPKIDSVYAKYTVYESFIENANGNFISVNRFGFIVYAKVKDPITTGDAYRWKMDGIFEYFSVTDIDSLDQCWAPTARLERTVNIFDDSKTNGQSFIQPIGIVPYERPTYYQVTISQFSLTANTHQFWKELNNQQQSTGSIFDPVPSPIRGNVYNIKDPDEKVLGLFSACGVSVKKLLINRFVESGKVSPSPNILPKQGNCRFHEPNGTIKKPAGFP